MRDITYLNEHQARVVWKRPRYPPRAWYTNRIISVVCLRYAGSCGGGKLIEQSSRTQHNHCGSCDADYHLQPGKYYFGKTCKKCAPGQHKPSSYPTLWFCIPYGGSCTNGELIEPSSRTQHDHCGSCHGGNFLLAARFANGYCKKCTAGQYKSGTNSAASCVRFDSCLRGPDG